MLGTMIARLERCFSVAPDARGFTPFMAVFAVYLAIRGIAYEDLRLLLIAAPLLLVAPARRVAALAALVVEGAVVREYPFLLSNHGFLEIWILVATAAAPTRRAIERRAYLRAMMAALVIFLLWAGAKKIAHGYYVPGDYFVVELAQPGKISERLAWLLSKADRATLAQYQDGLLAFAREGAAGVFAPPPPRLGIIPALSIFFCWTTLVAELGLPLLLLRERTRGLAIAALAAFIAGVQVLADEWHFALLFGALLVPWVPLAPARIEEEAPLPRAAPLALATLLAILALWPAVQFALTRTYDLNPWKLGGLAMYATPGRWEGSRIEIRDDPARGWRSYDQRAPGAPAAFLQRQEDVLKNAGELPSGAADAIAVAVRTGRRSARGVRILSRPIEFDRAAGRFRLKERVYEIR